MVFFEAWQRLLLGLGVPSSSGPKRKWRIICWQSDGDELYEVLNAQTQRFDETNSNPVIIGARYGPYASSLIGQVSYQKNGASGWLLQRLKGHQVWMSVVGSAMGSIYE